jgi:UDP-perosamine 4-acetyltransferase
MKARVICFGAGGHASVVVDLMQLLAEKDALEIVGLVAAESDADVLGVPVLGTDEALADIVARSSATHFIVAIGSIRGGGVVRPRLFAAGLSAGLVPFTAVHPTASVARSAMIGPGATIMAGAVVQARARIGANAIVNTRASVDHDSQVGDHAHLAPGVTCSGGVRIGENAHVGAGAVIIENIEIGAAATIGAGAVVISDCPAGTTVIGIPARPRLARDPGSDQSR